MDNLTLIEQLNDLGKSTREKNLIIKYKLSRTKEEYHPKPEAKELVKIKKPSKKAVQRTTLGIFLCVLIGSILVLSAIPSYSKMNDIIAVIDDPGEKYEAWLNLWDTAEDFSDLEEGWGAVEQEWNSRGVDVDWEYIKEVESDLGGFVFLERFDEQLMYSLSNDADGCNTAGAAKIIGGIGLIIPIIIFAIKRKQHLKVWREAMEPYNKIAKDNEIAKKYNDEELPKLIREWEEKAPEMYAKYEEEMGAHRAKVAQLEEIISRYAHLLPENYHYWAEDIASLIIRGSACNIEDAIKLYDEQREKEWEKERKEREIEQEREREQNRKKYAAQDRCRNCANKFSCSYSVKYGFESTGDVCASYRPR